MASRILPTSLSILETDKVRSFTINLFHARNASWIITPMKSFQIRRRRNQRIAFALDTGSSSSVPGGGGERQEINEDRTGLGSTRLGRIAIALGRQLLLKINSARKNFPMKIFLLLLGFYTANALATILGQTGDWDVLVAGIVVAAIEGIGMLMYKKKPSSSSSGKKLQSFVVFMNFWKAGVCLGLFVDAFKLGS
ncbi:PREDICTED: ycf20-like protein [Brassica oleracea var. oleracea]|uniref:ycf20-like protein n=1 Tax=Brassica oleracea var. oleracea TaxID=109376 RepID=UPI0006A6B8B7|nr:PREDICTED: ycf20-like protein [Brassica oleracea var. oleracea]